MMYSVVDDFLPKSNFKSIRDEIISPEFPWNYKSDISSGHGWDDESSLNSFGFFHVVHNEEGVPISGYARSLQGFTTLIYDCITQGDMEFTIGKCRVDMTTYSPEKHMHTPHVDVYAPHFASVYYLTDSDAETVIYDRQIYSHEEYLKTDLGDLRPLHSIEAKENRIVIFDGTYLHTGHSPSKYKNRIIINTDFLCK